MFGFLNPRPHALDYRRCYARMCVHHRRWYGLAPLAFHSYEAVFLYQLAADAGAVSAAVLPSHRCCRLARRGDPGKDPDAAVGRFASSVGVLLAAIKLDDDVRDSNSLAARVARLVLAGPIRRMRVYFEQLDPAFGMEVSGFVSWHHRLESVGGNPPIEEYAEPTARAFGYVFGLMAQLPGLAGCGDVFGDIGRAVGAAVIAFDCAADWGKDRRRGEYNPLPDAAAVRAATGYSADLLKRAAGRCRAMFGPDAFSTRTLLTVAHRVGRTETTACPAGPAWAGVLAGLSARVFVPKPVARLAPVGLPMAIEDPLGEGGVPPDVGPDAVPGDDREPSAGEPVRAAARRASNYCDCCTVDCGGCDGCGDGCNCCDGCGGCDCNCN